MSITTESTETDEIEIEVDMHWPKYFDFLLMVCADHERDRLEERREKFSNHPGIRKVTSWTIDRDVWEELCEVHPNAIDFLEEHNGEHGDDIAALRV